MSGVHCDSNTLQIYYWDSYWILQGLLKSELYLYAYDLITNFMDLIEVSHTFRSPVHAISCTGSCQMEEGESLVRLGGKRH